MAQDSKRTRLPILETSGKADKHAWDVHRDGRHADYKRHQQSQVRWLHMSQEPMLWRGRHLLHAVHTVPQCFNSSYLVQRLIHSFLSAGHPAVPSSSNTKKLVQRSPGTIHKYRLLCCQRRSDGVLCTQEPCSQVGGEKGLESSTRSPIANFDQCLHFEMHTVLHRCWTVNSVRVLKGRLSV